MLSRMRLPTMAPAEVRVERRGDGSLVLRSPLACPDPARCVGEWLERAAREAPERVFLSEGSGPSRRTLTYHHANDAVRSLGSELLGLGAGPEAPVVLLSDNSLDHALVQLAAMHVGAPAAPISPAYSLQSTDFVKLRSVVATVRPSVVFCADRSVFGKALAALALSVPVIDAADVRSLASASESARARRAHEAVGPRTIAKILFTSGSTGAPKGVINTQRMLCSNQEAIRTAWPFLGERPPVVVDWLPWSHTFGGNHNFGIVLRNQGTLHVDAGRPVPARIGETVQALRETPPTIYFNVPRGFDALLPHLESDPSFAADFFRELDLLFYAAAALPQSLWDRLARVAERVRPGGVPFVSAWGSTETSPLATTVHFPIPRAGVIGLPAPGCEVKLVPDGDKLEMRVRGPNVTPGAWEAGGRVRRVELDAEGFLPTGDAGRLEDPERPEAGLVFDGRTAENFKLTSGTWVAVGELRVRVVAACSPHVADAVIAGHDRDWIAAILLPSPGHTREGILAGLRAHDEAHPASSTRIVRAIVSTEPPSIDRGEITDKGYVNQRAVLASRADLVARLYAESPDEDVLVP